MRLSEQLRNEMLNNEKLCEDFPDVWEMLNEAADLLDVYYLQCKAASVAETRYECRRNVRLVLKEDSK